MMSLLKFLHKLIISFCIIDQGPPAVEKTPSSRPPNQTPPSAGDNDVEMEQQPENKTQVIINTLSPKI